MFARFPGLSRTRNKPPSFWAQGTQNDSRTDIKITNSESARLREALSSAPIEQELWQRSIAEEMESLQAQGTWVDVDMATCPPIPTHPVLQIKRTVNGEFERCTTRIVAGGDHQEYGVNYTDTYAPVIEWTVVRLSLYLSCVFSWEKMQVHVKTAFLKGELDEEVYDTP
jgi:Reverse transcriptase (RNA-dependent DNA polymerase)